MQPDIRIFQKRYGLSNKDMAKICQCSLPTVQKWRSGEVKPAGPAQQLMRLLDHSAMGDPAKLRQLIHAVGRKADLAGAESMAGFEEIESSMTKVMDRLQLMLESRKKERELAESEARYRSMVEAQVNPICRWRPDTTLTYVNPVYAELFSNFGDNLIGRKWIDFVPESRRAMIQAVVSDTVRRGEPDYMLHESVDRDGKLIFQEWYDIPVKNERGDVVEFHSVGRDVTELVNLREQVGEALKTSLSLMELCEQPILLLCQRGTFLGMNDRFREEILKGDSCSQLKDLLPGNMSGKFRKQLQRLSKSGQMNYRVQLHGSTWILKARLLSFKPGQEKFIIIFYRDSLEESRQVIQTRLANEFIIGGTPVDFKLGRKELSSIEKDMARLGEETKVDRIYVFTFDWLEGVFDNILEWCAQDVKPHIDDLKRVPIDDYAWWVNRMRKRQWIKQENVDNLPRTAARVREILQAQGIRSVLVAPFEVDGEVAGFVGFDQTSHERVWHSQEHQALEKLVAKASCLVEQAKCQAGH